MIDADEMLTLIESCRREMQAMLPADEFASLSSKTRQDYRQLGRTLLLRARYAEGGMAEVITATQRPTTYYKRVAALRYCLYADLVERLKSLHSALSARPVDELQVMAIQAQLQQQRAFLREFETARQSGSAGERRKRASKRQALRGLPGDWREQLYRRAAKGKYADAILVAALTGCRPEELRQGVHIRRVDNPRSGMGEIRFEIDGAKVKAHQGQPHRLIAYGAHDPHPLLEALRIRLAGRRELLVCIDSPVNFTVEVRRLAHSLWPKHKHKHAITAYCLRHQWAADLKRHAAADSVSQGLGHASAKTRRHYGQANQASSRHALQPIVIEAERPVKGAASSSSLKHGIHALKRIMAR
jgi:integrase